MKHFIISLINSGAVTILTSLAMTYKATHGVDLFLWVGNWLISWAIVCNYVYWIAPKISEKLHERL